MVKHTKRSVGEVKAESVEKNTYLQHHNGLPDQFTAHTHTHAAVSLQEAASSGYVTAGLDTK